MLESLLYEPAFDHHAHNVRKPECRLPFEAAFSESLCREVWERDTPHGLFLRRSVKQLAKLFSCPPTLQAVKAAREGMSLENLTRLCFEASHLSGIVLDDGLSPEEILDWSWHARFLPTKRLIRVEMVAEKLLKKVSDFDELEAHFRALLSNPPPEVVGFKTIAAYRGGLAISTPDRARARLQVEKKKPQRLVSSPLYHYLLQVAFEIASDLKLPFQIHTGFGDPDLDLATSNPLLLKSQIERYSCPFVLLHAGYPYFRELGFLASVYKNVWADFGLAVPFLSLQGMESALSGLLELCPLNKVMYSSDASLIPELFYLGSLNGRLTLRACLERIVDDGELSPTEALTAGRWILRENAERLYDRGGNEE